MTLVFRNVISDHYRTSGKRFFFRDLTQSSARTLAYAVLICIVHLYQKLNWTLVLIFEYGSF